MKVRLSIWLQGSGNKTFVQKWMGKIPAFLFRQRAEAAVYC
ncbi:hypothetical protein STRDD11_00796 [Streptococcus sp. DD11]|nr:hypothetical protein STRDD11_00796 [Streptococcus sp. DD11]